MAGSFLSFIRAVGTSALTKEPSLVRVRQGLTMGRGLTGLMTPWLIGVRIWSE